MKRIGLAVLLLAIGAGANERISAFYKISRLNQESVGISCPGNNGDPTVAGNVGGVLIVSCGK
jgi:hypothetical protein